MNSRVLALDVGLRRIGLAVSDALGMTAQGLPTLERRNLRTDLTRLDEVARAHEARTLLCGLPKHLSGTEGRQAELVRAFGDKLSTATGLPVIYWDERLTTVEAQRVLRQVHTSRDRARQAIDRLAAVILLQSYLDAQAGGSASLA